jgi:ankyrin repeat protein
MSHPVVEAVIYGNRSKLAKLLSTGNSANRPLRGPDGECVPLISLASQFGHSEVVALLIRHDAAINAEMSDGATALFTASENGQVTVVRILLDRGAVVNHARHDGVTA